MSHPCIHVDPTTGQAWSLSANGEWVPCVPVPPIPVPPGLTVVSIYMHCIPCFLEINLCYQVLNHTSVAPQLFPPTASPNDVVPSVCLFQFFF